MAVMWMALNIGLILISRIQAFFLKYMNDWAKIKEKLLGLPSSFGGQVVVFCFGLSVVTIVVTSVDGSVGLTLKKKMWI